MTGVVLAAVVVLAILVLLDLLLTGAVIRRLRDHADRISALASRPMSGLRQGEAAPVHDPSDAPDVADDVAIAFFSASCQACRLHLGEFLALADRRGRDRSLVVVAGSPHDGRDLIEAAEEHCAVLAGEDADRWADAYKIEAFPTFVAVRDRIIHGIEGSASALSVDEVGPTAR
jgi:hypothetical protein